MTKILLICLLITSLVHCQPNILFNSLKYQTHEVQQKVSPAVVFKVPVLQKHIDKTLPLKNQSKVNSTQEKLKQAAQHKNQVNHTHTKNHTWTKPNNTQEHHNRTTNNPKPHQEFSKFNGIFRQVRGEVHTNEIRKNENSNHLNRTNSANHAKFNHSKFQQDHKNNNTKIQSQSNKPKESQQPKTTNSKTTSVPPKPKNSHFKISCKTDNDCKKAFPYILAINFKISCKVSINKCQFN